MKYRSEIDGLRAIAVIPVILYHAGIKTISGGFVGVDIFFVISGYLITTIILSEMEQNTFSIVNFYERRARRILPALFLVMLVSFPFAWFLLMPSEMKGFSESLAAVSSFSSNILFWKESDYFDTANELKPLLHTWSLAVEEQYYILFPLFLMLMWRYRKRWILSLFMLVAGISLATAQWGAYNKPSATFYLLPTRGWELAIGAGIAFYFIYRKETIRTLLSHKLVDEMLGALGFVMIGCSIFIFNKHTPFPSIYTLLPTVGTGLIILFSSSQTMIGRLLSTKPLVTIGLISYSAYLWHQPIFAFARHLFFSEPGYLVFLCLTILVFLLSYLTWKFVERPFRNKNTFGRKEIFIFAIAGSLAFILVGAIGHLNNGFKQRSWYANLFQKDYQPDNSILQTKSWEHLIELSGNDRYGIEHNEYDEKLWFLKNDERENLLLVGNSHSKDIYNILINSNYAKSRYQIARYGVQIRRLTKKDSGLFSSPNYKHSDIVMLVSRYEGNDVARLEQVVQKIIKDKKRVVIVKNIFEFDFFGGRNLADVMLQREYLKRNKNGDLSAAKIVKAIDKVYYTQYSTRGRSPEPKKSDDAIDVIAKKYSDILILDRMDYACDQKVKRCYGVNDKFEKYYYDYGHHTLEGASFFGKRVDQVEWLGLLSRR